MRLSLLFSILVVAFASGCSAPTTVRGPTAIMAEKEAWLPPAKTEFAFEGNATDATYVRVDASTASFRPNRQEIPRRRIRAAAY